MSGRYKVLVGSQSGHCCFDYTVVDTLKPHPVYASQGLFDAICETFSEEKAHAVARALNAATRSQRRSPNQCTPPAACCEELMRDTKNLSTVCEVCRRSTGDIRKYSYRGPDGDRTRVRAHEGCWKIYRQKNGLHDRAQD